MTQAQKENKKNPEIRETIRKDFKKKKTPK
jgi:hypothetical protein